MIRLRLKNYEIYNFIRKKFKYLKIIIIKRNV